MARDRTRKQIRDALLDELLESCDGPEDVLGKDGLIRQLTGRLVERVLDAELTDHRATTSTLPQVTGAATAATGTARRRFAMTPGRWRSKLLGIAPARSSRS